MVSSKEKVRGKTSEAPTEQTHAGKWFCFMRIVLQTMKEEACCLRADQGALPDTVPISQLGDYKVRTDSE